MRRTIPYLVLFLLFLGSAGILFGACPDKRRLFRIVFGLNSDQGPNPQDVSTTLKVLFLLTILSLLPSIAIMATAFISVFPLSWVLFRRAIGTQQTPSNEIIVGLSLFLTFYIMTPVFDEMNNNAIQPYLNNQIKPLAAGRQECIRGNSDRNGFHLFMSCCKKVLCLSENLCGNKSAPKERMMSEL